MNTPSTHLSELRAFQDRTEKTRAKRTRFLTLYRPVILAWCCKKVQPIDAEDLTQEIMIKLLRKLPAHRHDPGRAPFRSWVKTIVNNAIRDYWRSRQKVDGRLLLADSLLRDHPAKAATASEPLTPPSRQAEIAAEIVARVQARTSKKSWEIFRQVAIERATATEVADRFGLTVGAVYKCIFRVKSRLHEEYRNAWNQPPVPQS